MNSLYRMPYTSQTRQDKYDYLRYLSRHRIISSEVFRSEKAKIDEREAKAVAKAVAKAKAKEEEIIAKREARKAETKKRNEAKAEAKKREKIQEVNQKLINAIPGNLLLHKYTAVEGEKTIREMWKLTVGTTARFIGGRVDETINVESGDKAYKKFRLNFTNYEGDELRFKIGDVFRIFLPTRIPARKLIQRFRDGINHCVFVPMIDKLTKMLDNVSDSTKKRLGQRIKKLQKLSVIYDEAVPEDKMEEVVKASGLKFILCDIFKSEIAVYNKDGRVGTVIGTNGRENHIDVGVMVDSDHIELEQDEMNKLWKTVQKDYQMNKDFYRIEGDLREGTPSKICTMKGAWRVKDPDRDACIEFDKELGIINYKINAIKQPELNAFLKAGRIINGWSTTLGDRVATGCADMPSAYTQFKKCHKYSGFLGHIHQFRSGKFSVDFVKEHLGYYQIIIRGGIDWLMEKLGLYVGLSTVLFSPEILYFIDNGLEVDIVQGAWGSRFDFDFPEYMMELVKGKKYKRYAAWAGRLGIERMETSHTIPASSEWASHLAVKHNVYYWREQGLVTIKKPVKKCFTAHHIFGGLTSYVRIQMMEAMKMFEPSNLVRVVLDGIYYCGEKPAGLAWFSDKDVKINESSMPWYNEEEVPVAPPLCRIIGNSLLTGQGGSGKTYSVFKNPGFNTILYVSPSHILGQDVRDKYGAIYTTIHKLIGIDCRPYSEEYRVPPVIFIDEITQIDASWIDKAFQMYPSSLILLAGDVDSEGRWYQCRSGCGDEWNTIWKPVEIFGCNPKSTFGDAKSKVDVIEYLEDRRSQDDELKTLKLRIRDAMKACNLDSGMFEMEEWARKNLPISEFNFQPGDTCIAGTHRTNAKLLEKGIVSGYYKKGGYVSDVELPEYEKRGSFTIHSFQGRTIENGNIWIFIDDLFEYAMLYTAVSRAVRISQIKFVKARNL